MLLGSLTSLQQIMLLVLDSVYDAPTLELLLRSECKHFYESFILKKTHQHFSRHLRWFTDGGRGEVGLSADLGVTALLLMKISTWPRHRHINAVNFLPGAGLNIIPALGRPLYLRQGGNTAFPAAAFCCPTCSSPTSWRPTRWRWPRCGTATFPAAATCRPPCPAHRHLAGEASGPRHASNFVISLLLQLSTAARPHYTSRWAGVGAVASPKQTGVDTSAYKSYSARGVAASELFRLGCGSIM